MTDAALPRHELAQLNIAQLAAPIDSPQLVGFVSSLERINALAEASPGFVWRLQDEAGDATAIRHFGDDVIINMSVWRDVASLQDYVYRSAHTEVLRRRQEWFEKIRESYLALWWVPAGHRPSLDEAGSRLESLRRNGPTVEAFSFKKTFTPPGA